MPPRIIKARGVVVLDNEVIGFNNKSGILILSIKNTKPINAASTNGFLLH